jgi:hypothetical protein
MCVLCVCVCVCPAFALLLCLDLRLRGLLLCGVVVSASALDEGEVVGLERGGGGRGG